MGFWADKKTKLLYYLSKSLVRKSTLTDTGSATGTGSAFFEIGEEYSEANPGIQSYFNSTAFS